MQTTIVRNLDELQALISKQSTKGVVETTPTKKVIALINPNSKWPQTVTTFDKDHKEIDTYERIWRTKERGMVNTLIQIYEVTIHGKNCDQIFSVGVLINSQT